VQEDKIVQRATVEVLNAIYERDFLGFSYGFRPGKSQQLALDALSVGIMRKKVSWLIEAWFPSVRIYHPHPLERVRV
jgi:RNA-directed DNA polymerase